MCQYCGAEADREAYARMVDPGEWSAVPVLVRELGPRSQQQLHRTQARSLDRASAARYGMTTTPAAARHLRTSPPRAGARRPRPFRLSTGNFMGLKLKFRPRNGVKMALRSRPQAKPAAGAHQRFLSPLPLPRRAPHRISRHFIMGLKLIFRPRNGVKMALTKPAAGQARRRRSPATSEPPASAAPRSASLS